MTSRSQTRPPLPPPGVFDQRQLRYIEELQSYIARLTEGNRATTPIIAPTESDTLGTEGQLARVNGIVSEYANGAWRPLRS